MRRRLLASVLLLATSFVERALAQNYLPLEIGWQWYYTSNVGSSESMRIIGERLVRGRFTRIRRQVITGVNAQVFENYWSVNPEGDLLLHGAQNLSHGFIISYEPPLLWLDAPLALGRFWTTSFMFCPDLDGIEPCQGPYDLSNIVISEGNETVPAGTFYCYGIGAYFPLMVEDAGQWFDPLGRFLPERASADPDTGDIFEWYSDGLGLARIEEFLLESWSSPPTATLSTTWGGIKGLYR